MCFVPPVGFLYAMLGLCVNPSKWKKYIPFLISFLFIGAYVFNPPIYTENFDLTRYLPDIETFGRLSLKEAFEYYPDVLYARDILFWLFGHLGIPHMVPALTTAMVYGVAFYITGDTAERYRAQKHIPKIIFLQLAMLPYINLINNVRNVFSFSLIILAAYMDIVKEKRSLGVLLCYVFGCLMHLSAVIFIVFRLLCRPMKRLFTVVLVFPFAFSSVIMLLYNNIGMINVGGSLGSSIKLAIMKLYWYMTDTSSDYAMQSLNSITVRIDRLIMAVGMILGLVLVCYALHKKDSLLRKNDVNMMTFVGLTASLTLASNAFAMPNFWRFAAAFYVMAGVLLLPFISQKSHVNPLLQISIWGYIGLGALSFAMQCYKCTWFDFPEWILAFLTTNLLIIPVDIIKACIGVA